MATPEPEPTPTPEPRNPEWTDDFNPVTGWDMMEKLGAGINFAGVHWSFYNTPLPEWQTIDAYHIYGTAEHILGQEEVEEWHIQAVAEKGFQTIQIDPVFGVDVIDDSWLDRIQQITDWSLRAGLNVVITVVEPMQEKLNRLTRDTAFGVDYDDASRQYCAVLSQLAERFKNYPEDLVFRILNEPHIRPDGMDDDDEYWSSYLPANVDWHCEVVDRLHKDALDIIRSNGGNNNARVVILSSYYGGTPQLEYMLPPDDEYIMYGVFAMPEGDSLHEAGIEMLSNGVPLFYIEFAFFMEWFDYGTSEIDVMHAILKRDTGIDIPIPCIYSNYSCSDWGERPDWAQPPIFNMSTGDWINEHILNAFLEIYSIEPGPCGVVIPTPEFPYEWVPRSPYDPTNQFLFFPPMSVKKYAMQMIVELNGDIGQYEFMTLTKQPPWNSGLPEYVSYGMGSERITEGDGIIIFDLRGLAPYPPSFRVFNVGDAGKVERIYIDNTRTPIVYEPWNGPWNELISCGEDTVCNVAFMLTDRNNWDDGLFGVFPGEIRIGEVVNVSYTLESYSPSVPSNGLYLCFNNGTHEGSGFIAYKVTVSNATLTKDGILIADISHLNRTQIFGQDRAEYGWEWIAGFADQHVNFPDAEGLVDAVLSMDILIHEVRVSS